MAALAFAGLGRAWGPIVTSASVVSVGVRPSQRAFVERGPDSPKVEAPVLMRTMGLDISSAKARTAWAAIDWEADRALVSEPVSGLDDAKVIKRLASADWVGIDGPLAWPRPMAEALHSYVLLGEWPETAKEAFRYRRTDLALHETVLEETGKKIWPMSVSADRSALTAWRLAGLREAAYELSGVRFDLSGSDQVLEVHPPAALILWGLGTPGYKKSGDRARRSIESEARRALIGGLEEQAPWLSWAPGARDTCIESADALDAVLAALIARAVARGLSFEPEEKEESELARAEGWTHLPKKDSLGSLVGD